MTTTAPMTATEFEDFDALLDEMIGTDDGGDGGDDVFGVGDDVFGVDDGVFGVDDGVFGVGDDPMSPLTAAFAAYASYVPMYTDAVPDYTDAVPVYTDAVPVYTDADATPAPAPAPTVAFVTKKGMRDDPSAPWFVSAKNDDTDATAGGERVKTDRRAAHKNPVVYDMLSETVRGSLPETVFPDRISVPSVSVESVSGNVEYLDLVRVASELARPDTSFSTIAVSRAALAAMLGTATDINDPAANVIGKMILVFGRIRGPSGGPSSTGKRSAFVSNSLPISDVMTDERHSFAFQPVVISTIGDVPGDQGEFAVQGVIVSNKAINFSTNDPRRVTLGRNPAFEESMCWVLVTHVYPSYMTYANVGPCGTKKTPGGGGGYEIVRDPNKNAFDHVFLWTEFMSRRTDQRGCGVSSFGLADSKQTGRDIARRMFPWSISHSQNVLRELRGDVTGVGGGDDGLRAFLLETPTTLAGKRAAARETTPSGIDVRRFLLVELLLLGTPLEPLLRGETPIFDFAPPLISSLIQSCRV